MWAEPIQGRFLAGEGGGVIEDGILLIFDLNHYKISFNPAQDQVTIGVTFVSLQCDTIFNPLTPISDQNRISPYNTDKISTR